MEVPINLLKIELENNQNQVNYYKDVDNNLAIQYKKRVIEIKKAIAILERALAELSSVSQVNELLPHVSNSVCPCTGNSLKYDWCVRCDLFNKCKLAVRQTDC